MSLIALNFKKVFTQRAYGLNFLLFIQVGLDGHHPRQSAANSIAYCLDVTLAWKESVGETDTWLCCRHPSDLSAVPCRRMASLPS